MSEVESGPPIVFESGIERIAVDTGTQEKHKVSVKPATTPVLVADSFTMNHSTAAKVSPNTSPQLEEAVNEISATVDAPSVLVSVHSPDKRIICSSLAVSPEEAPASPKTPERVGLFPQKPETTLSLDKEEEVSDLEKSPPDSGPETINSVHRHQLLAANDDISVRAEPGEGDDDSSNDDSSYFNDPNHLPEPGSGRKYSFSSNASLGNHSISQQQSTHLKGRDSDASLSLSEDSDNEHQHHHRSMYPVNQQPQLPTQPVIFNPHPQLQYMMPQSVQPNSVPELYPKQLTRMHSYSSLVSSSQNSDDENSPSDTSLRNELQNVAIENRALEGPTPDGRRSPVPMRGSSINPLFASPSTVNPSPPTIHQEYPVGHIPHPQPHLMTPEELAAWTAMPPPARYAYDPRQGVVPAMGSGRSQASDLAYSVDSDSQMHHGEFSKPRRSKPSRSRRHGSRERNVGDESRAVTFSPTDEHPPGDRDAFKVYWQRWIMLMVGLLQVW